MTAIPNTMPARASITATRRRAANAVVLAWLALTLPLLVRAAPRDGGVVVAAAHVALFGVFAWSWSGRARDSRLADWLPALAIPLLYAELPFLMGAGAYHDAAVQRWESALFGGQPARDWAVRAPSRALSELLHAGYLSYYALLYVPLVLLYRRARGEAAFGRLLLAMMLAFVACYAAFVMFPVEGPRYAWGVQPGVPDGPVRRLVLALLAGGSSRGTAFPSSHAAVATAIAVTLLAVRPRMGAAVAIAAALLCGGAVYGGFHYALDVAAGALVGVVSAAVAARAAVRHPSAA